MGILATPNSMHAQSTDVSVKLIIIDNSTQEPIPYATVWVKTTGQAALANEQGKCSFSIPTSIPRVKVEIQALGYEKNYFSIEVSKSSEFTLALTPIVNKTDEVVVTGTLKEVNKLNSAVPVEVYSPVYFKKNPTPNVFESLTMVNGVQPQLNCGVCYTGDIHINGIEGPYTMVLIDGMPIVSSLATVYGLMGMPNSMIKRVEIIKGPAGALFGSEAVAGIINIITKDPDIAPKASLDLMATDYQDVNTDVTAALKSKYANGLVGINYYTFNKKWDKNNDGFTDVTLQNRISVFNKWNFKRPSAKTANLAARYVYEDRFGGQMNWTPEFRGSDSIYGESIYTSRFELFGNYDLPVNEKITLQYSFNNHDQNSMYGTNSYVANQVIFFAQLLWDKKWHYKHDLLLGVPFRYVYYDDNTVGTQRLEGRFIFNQPQYTYMPGIFAQDEWKIKENLSMLSGIRLDHHNVHGLIYSPRVSLKYSPSPLSTFRLTAGNGFRVVNLFTEDHAALTGARQVVIVNELKPERSWNVGLNYSRFVNFSWGFIGLDINGFYTYFTNKIVGDFLTDPQKIIYDNINGYAVSRGVSANTELQFNNGFKATVGATFMDVFQTKDNEKIPQLFAPAISGTYALSYSLARYRLKIDYTGRVYGPMHLPVVENDFRPPMSPWFDLANVQITKTFPKSFEVYGGVKNIWNFVPENPLLRPFDPFDKQVQILSNGEVVKTPDNPNGYTFDTAYNYAPLQTIRGFIGARWMW